MSGWCEIKVPGKEHLMAKVKVLSWAEQLLAECENLDATESPDAVYDLYCRVMAHEREAREMKPEALRLIGSWMRATGNSFDLGDGYELRPVRDVKTSNVDSSALARHWVHGVLVQQLEPESEEQAALLFEVAGEVAALFGSTLPLVTAGRVSFGENVANAEHAKHVRKDWGTLADGKPAYVAKKTKRRAKK